MSNFVDLHHHLVYGVDDGAGSLENMQQMILRAAEQGVTDIVCTSHVTPGYEPFPREKYAAHFAQAEAFIQEQDIDLRIHQGCEVLYTDAAARLVREGHYPTLAGSNMVLVEFAPDATFRELLSAATSFGMAGYSVLFAHVERYDALRNMKNVRKLRDEFSVYMQMNANTVINPRGFFHRRWVKKLLSSGCIDCVATDAHNLSSRPCQMRRCYDVLTEQYGAELAEELCGGFQRRMLEI
nr:hypothetical protein [Clostridia bacterium]